MAVTTSNALLALLEKSRLLPPQELDRAREPGESDPQAIAQAWIAQGLISRWQAQQLLAGRHSFFLGKYKLLDKLGEGGMGAVYKAVQTTTGRQVALKVMSEKVVKQPGAVSRFHREIRAVAALQHPNIVAAFDADQVGETHFLVMEFAEGRDLKEWIKEFGRLPIDWSCECIRQAALGLQHAHERGLAHRDIKPSNILVVDGECTPHAPREENGLTRSVRSTLVVKILDMGLARFTSETQCTVLTQTGQCLGTIDYISPEQAKDTKSAGIQADVFSLGASLFHMLCGQVPYTGKNPMEKLMARAMRDAPRAITLRPDIPAELEEIIARMLARKVNDRFQTPDEVVQVLTPFCLGASSEQCTPHAPREETGLTRSVRSTLGPIEAEPDATLNQFLNVLGEVAAAEPAREPEVSSRPDRKRPRTAKWIAVAALALLAVGIGVAWRFSGGTQVSSVPKSTTYPPIDLLKLIDPKRDAVQGEWKFEGDKLVTPEPKEARLMVRFKPPDEYDLTIQAERKTGDGCLMLGILATGRQAGLVLDGWGGTVSGLDMLDGKHARDNETKSRGGIFPRDKRVSITCEVRKSSIHVRSGETKIVDWKGEGQRLSLDSKWAVPDKSVLFLGSYGSSFHIHSFTLTPLSGPGEIVSPASPVDEAFIKQIAAQPPQEQIRLVVEKLKAINPGFDGKVNTALSKDGTFVESFQLPSNKAVRDMSPVRALGKLTRVDIPGTPIASLEPLRGMKLTSLICYDTPITSLEPLAGMPLKSLSCYRTPIANLEPLRSTKLTNLDLGANKVSDLGPLSGLPLTTLNCAFNSIASLAPLSGLPLTTLNCSDTIITSLEPLKGMKLMDLDIRNTNVSDLGGLRGMPLTVLRCSGTPVSSLEPLRGMRLTGLSCLNTPITSLEPLAGMPLTGLGCQQTRIASLEPLRGMKLTSLSCYDTPITSLEPLTGMPLAYLWCDEALARKHADLLKSMKTLVKINDLPVADFWKKRDSVSTVVYPPIDLLKLIDVKRDAVRGEWKFEGDKLVTPSDDVSRLMVRYRPPEEYDLTIQAERKSGTLHPSFGILAGGRQTLVVLDGWDGTTSGLNLLDGKHANNNESTTHRVVYPQDKPVTVTCEVRKTGIVVRSGDTKIIDWKGDLKRLSLEGNWAVPDPSLLLLGSHLTSFHIHSATLTPLSGPGEIVPPGQPPPAIAPFDAGQARSHQEAWARHLGVAVETTNSIGMNLVLVPPGEFQMGTPQAEVDRLKEQNKTDAWFVEHVVHEVPEHHVRITRPFLLGKHEVTQGQFSKVMGTNPSQFKRKGWRSPVEQISWYDAVAFCNKLSEHEKRQPCYRIDGNNVTLTGSSGYRLPTEAEWEYACRAGTTTNWWCGDELPLVKDFGWCNETAGGETHLVGEKLANGFGLHDLHGNVWEWCWDWHGKYDAVAANDPVGPVTGSIRVNRGGSWGQPAWGGRSAYRGCYEPAGRWGSIGFRLAVSPSGK